MSKSIGEIGYPNALSAIGLRALLVLRLELKLDPAACPVLMRHLETLPKKMMASSILALAERGARSFYFPHMGSSEQNFSNHVSPEGGADRQTGGNLLTNPNEAIKPKGESMDWMDESLISMVTFSTLSEK